VIALVAIVFAASGAVAIGLVAGIASAAAIVGAPILRRVIARADALAGLSSGKLSAAQIQQIPLPANFVPVTFAFGASTAKPLATGISADVASKIAHNFRVATSALFS